MSAEPIKLVTPPKAADDVRESVVRILRNALAEAETGNVDTVVVIMGHPDGDWSNKCSTTLKFSEAIGRMFIAMQEWTTLHNERN